MKKIFFLFFIALINVSFAQKQTLFLDKNLDDVIKLSRIEKKPIVVMYYATWCVHCNKMKNEVFTDVDVVNYYTTNYICMAVDAESPEGTNLKNRFQTKFKVKSYPTFTFIDSDETLLSCISGEFKKEDFINEGKNALIPQNQFNTIKNNFNADVSNADNCLKFITTARKAGFDATPITQKYLKTKTNEEWFSELNWRIMANGINDIEADEIKYIAAHQAEFAKVSSPTRVEKKLVFVASDNLKTLAELGDTIDYYKKRSIAESFKIRKVDSLLFRYDLVITERVSSWKKYESTAQNNVEKFVWKDSNTLIEISSNFLNFITDKKALESAVNWTKQALSLGESLEKYKLISKLYLKLKDYNNALEYAEKGKTTAINFGWKTDEMEQLITEIKSKR